MISSALHRQLPRYLFCLLVLAGLLTARPSSAGPASADPTLIFYSPVTILQEGVPTSLRIDVANLGLAPSVGVDAIIMISSNVRVNSVISTPPVTVTDIGTSWQLHCVVDTLAAGATVALEVNIVPGGAPDIVDWSGGVTSSTPDANLLNNSFEQRQQIQPRRNFDLGVAISSSSLTRARGLEPIDHLLDVRNYSAQTVFDVTFTERVSTPTLITDAISKQLLSQDALAICTWNDSLLTCHLDSLTAGQEAHTLVSIDGFDDVFFTSYADIHGYGNDFNSVNDTTSSRLMILPIPDFVVNTTDVTFDGSCDSLHCSLADALDAASGVAGPSIVGFRIPGPGPHHLLSSTGSYSIDSETRLDGWYEDSFQGQPLIEIDDQLSVGNSRAHLRGLSTSKLTTMWNILSGAPRPVPTDTITVEGCWIGLRTDGVTPFPGALSRIGDGITPSWVRVGRAGLINRNIVSGGDYGIAVGESSNLLMENTWVGLDASGAASVGNLVWGVYALKPGHVIIGGPNPGQGNIISGNGGQDVVVTPPPHGGIYVKPDIFSTIVIDGNLIGLDSDGTSALGNIGAGVYLDGGGLNLVPATHTLVQVGTPGVGNVIAATARVDTIVPSNYLSDQGSLDGVGIAVCFGAHFRIEGNRIGVDPTGTRAIPNVGYGVQLYWSLGEIQIGSPTLEAGNIISGNGLGGIGSYEASHNIIQGNIIGLDASGTALLNGNQSPGSGIRAENASYMTVGGSATGAGNVISGQANSGMLFWGAFDTVSGNHIGTDSTGLLDLGNGGAGINFWGGAIAIGDSTSGVGNTISGNALDGIASGSCQDCDIFDNRIGIGDDDVTTLPNRSGVSLFNSYGTASAATNFNVGAPGHGNHIAANSDAGVKFGGGNYNGATVVANNIHGNGGPGFWSTWANTNLTEFGSTEVVSNRFVANGGIAIDLGNIGFGPIDTLDTDMGDNGLMNPPRVTSAVLANGQIHLIGNLSSLPNADFRLDVYASHGCDANGFAQAEVTLGSFAAHTAATGFTTYDVLVTAPVDLTLTHLAITSTELTQKSTSEFSRCVALQGTLSAVPSVTPLASGLVSASPNPFNPRTAIRFAVAEPGQFSLIVYNIRGERIRTLISHRNLSAGIHTVFWNGRDHHNQRATSGLYLAQLRHDIQAVGTSLKLILLQ